MEALHSGTETAGLTAVHAAIIDYVTDPVGVVRGLRDADLLAELRSLEVAERRLASARHARVAELDRRDLARPLGATNVKNLLVAMLRISPAEAKRRVTAAHALSERVSMVGQLLVPVLPSVASAAGEGAISPEQVGLIIGALDELPDLFPVEEFERAEQVLTTAARECDPKQLAAVATRLIDTVLPDGVLPDEAEAARHRGLSLHTRRDGAVEGTFRLTPAQGAKAIAVLQGQAAPTPAEDGTPDPRSSSQRLADAFEDLCDLALHAGRVTPTGPSVQLSITMTAQQYTELRGVARTSYGQPLRPDTALGLSREAALAIIVRDSRGSILQHRRARRLASKAQREAVAARDRGCSAPHCTAPPEWVQLHHVIPWWQGGPTDVGNLAGACGCHHRHLERLNWRCVMKNGLPYWIPPAWIDPTQTPQHNRHHHQ
ncbi:MAG: endonuclease [Frankiales bacterium]|nr:endonuclease [Frankiales bacterium]